MTPQSGRTPRPNDKFGKKGISKRKRKQAQHDIEPAAKVVAAKLLQLRLTQTRSEWIHVTAYVQPLRKQLKQLALNSVIDEQRFRTRRLHEPLAERAADLIIENGWMEPVRHRSNNGSRVVLLVSEAGLIVAEGVGEVGRSNPGPGRPGSSRHDTPPASMARQRAVNAKHPSVRKVGAVA